MVLGPLLLKQNYTQVPTSIGLVKRLMDKSTPAVPKLSICITDARDVALAHIQALKVEEANGKNFIKLS